MKPYCDDPKNLQPSGIGRHICVLMKPKMLNLQRHFFVRAGSLLLLLLALRLGLTTARADAVSDLASFSIFDKVDLAQLAKSDVKTAHGSPMSNPRFLAVQSCYVALGSSPAQQIEALRRWDATRHRELKVFLHSDLPSNPTPANFEKLKSAPGNASVRSFVAATQKLAPGLQISKDEAKKFSAAAGGGGGTIPAPVATFWADILTARTKSFVSGGMSAQPPYDHAGPSVRASDEVNGLLREQGKIRNQFSGLLGATGIGRGAGSLKPELYWELLDADDQGVITLGASYSRGGAGGTYQAADVLYYASGGYYVALTLYQMWTVTVEGKPSTLVWRGDMISAASLGSLHGVERLGSESVMMKNITKAVTLFRRDSSGGR